MSRIAVSLYRRTTGLLAAGAAVAALLLAAGPAAAQSGAVAGTVTDATGDPVQHAEISVVGTRIGALTDADGAFRLTGVPAGTHDVRIRHVSYQARMLEGVEVRPGETTRVDAVLEVAAHELGELVVSASRGVERITDAPATITKVNTEEIDRSVGNSFVGALKAVKGLEYIQVGVTTAQLNARGFNTTFNNRLLMIEDGRLAVLPESGLPVGTFTAIPKIDLESVEVVVGPGSALYGADASNGVINLQTKDIRDHQGTDIEVEGGTRERVGVQFRHAQLLGDDGRFGFKVTGEWQQVHDFENVLSFQVGNQVVTDEGVTDFENEVYRGQAQLAYYGDDFELRLTGGGSATWGIGQTNVGRNQFTPWTYNFTQLELESDHWWVNLYRTRSNPGETFATDRFVQLRAAGVPNAREEASWPGFGELWVGEVQGDYTIPELLNTDVTFGVEYRRDRVGSEEKWLTDRQTGEPFSVDRFGGFAQTRTPLTPAVDLLLAARVDAHEDFDTQFSPKAGFIFEAGEDHTVRATFNRAFKSPTTLQRHFFIPDFVPFVSVLGNRNGFTVRDQQGNVVQEVESVEPEVNNTWELGYRGLVGERLLIDVTGWFAQYNDFLGSLLPINNPFDPAFPTFAHDHEGNLIATDIGPQIVLTYQNLGEADLLGFDGEVRYAVAPDVLLTGTLSVLEDVTLKDAPGLNSSGVRWNLAGDFENLPGGGYAGFLLRTVNGYRFESGINVGKVPTFNTLNVHAGYRFPGTDLDARLTVQNLFTCRTVVENDPISPAETPGSRECGFDEPHIEMINMPAQEASLVATLRYSF